MYYEDLLQAELGVCKIMKPPELVPETKLYESVPYHLGGYSSWASLEYVLTRE